MTTAFLKAVEKTLLFEGGFSDDPEDPGNWTGGKKGVGELKGTNHGISAMMFPDEDIANVSTEKARRLYYERFWKPLNLDLVTADRAPVADLAFDINVNQGPAEQLLQGALILLGHDIKLDGIVGPKTISALNSDKNWRDVYELLLTMRRMLWLVGAASVDEIIVMIKPRKEHVRRYMRGWMTRR